MGKASLTNGRSSTAIFLAHVGAFLFVVLAAYWLRRIALQPDAILQVPVYLDPEVLVDALYGPLIYRMLTGYYPIDNSFTNQIRRVVFEGIIRGDK